jgi:hypothetical protein
LSTGITVLDLPSSLVEVRAILECPYFSNREGEAFITPSVPNYLSVSKKSQCPKLGGWFLN